MPEFTEQEIDEKAKHYAGLADNGEANSFYQELNAERDNFKGNPKQWQQMIDKIHEKDEKGKADDVYGGGVVRQNGKDVLVIPGLVYKY